jgi:hypothetical protein
MFVMLMKMKAERNMTKCYGRNGQKVAFSYFSQRSLCVRVTLSHAVYIRHLSVGATRPITAGHCCMSVSKCMPGTRLLFTVKICAKRIVHYAFQTCVSFVRTCVSVKLEIHFSAAREFSSCLVHSRTHINTHSQKFACELELFHI